MSAAKSGRRWTGTAPCDDSSGRDKAPCDATTHNRWPHAACPATSFDVNVSIRFTEDGQVRWPPLSEIKNMNSYAALEEALPYEADRLWREWQSGGDLRTRKGKITVGWSPERKQTFLQRSKEDVQDYRYFPEPDLVAFAPSRADVERLRASIPELPTARRSRFMRDYGLSEYDARILVDDRALAEFFEESVRASGGDAKAWLTWSPASPCATSRMTAARSLGRDQPAQLGALVSLVEERKGSGRRKDVFAEMWLRAAPEAIVNAKGLSQVSDAVGDRGGVDAVLAENPEAVADTRRATSGRRRPRRARDEAHGRQAIRVINRILAERISRGVVTNRSARRQGA